jgi:cytochrome b involved in lipid metabolism
MPQNNDDSNSMMLPPPNRPSSSSGPKQEQQEQPDAVVEVGVDRQMNDTTMPPPKKRNANTTTTTTTSKPSRTTAVNPRARKKVFGLNDWKRLLQSSSDLAQRKGAPLRRDITVEEVMLHNRNHDGWISLRGRVYNIGPYLAYHPGGVGIFKSVLGKDATSLFDKYHRWVNVDGLIGPLLLGTLMVTPMATPTRPSFSVVPPKESHLSNAPRVSAQKASGSSLLFGAAPLADDDENEDDDLLLL